MATNALNKLHSLQKSLFENALSHAHSFSTMNAKSILEYSHKFTNSLPDHAKSCDASEIFTSIRNNQFIFFGDFHTLPESQLAFIETLKSYLAADPDADIIVCLEMFKSEHQALLDKYLHAQLSEEKFLALVNYKKDWGFPFAYYRPILEFAREKKLPVAAINAPVNGIHTLEKRDINIVNNLLKIHNKSPKAKLFTLIGEFHLADAHLPKTIKRLRTYNQRQPTFMRMLTNIDKYFFENIKENQFAPPEFLKLQQDFYCLMTTPPWIKWQSYANWEEHLTDHSDAAYEELEFGDFEHQAFSDFRCDLDNLVYQLLKQLCDFFQFDLSESTLRNFHLYYDIDKQLFRELQSDGFLTNPQQQAMIESRLKMDGLFVLDNSPHILMPTHSLHKLSEACGQLLHVLLTKNKPREQSSVLEFYQYVIKFCAGRIAALILNPKEFQTPLTTNIATHQDVRTHQQILNNLKDVNAAQLAVHLFPIIKKNAKLDFEICKGIAYDAAHSLFREFVASKIEVSILREIFGMVLTGQASELRSIFKIITPATLTSDQNLANSA